MKDKNELLHRCGLLPVVLMALFVAGRLYASSQPVTSYVGRFSKSMDGYDPAWEQLSELIQKDTDGDMFMVT